MAHMGVEYKKEYIQDLLYSGNTMVRQEIDCKNRFYAIVNDQCLCDLGTPCDCCYSELAIEEEAIVLQKAEIVAEIRDDMVVEAPIIDETPINFDGLRKECFSLSINGDIPAPMNGIIKSCPCGLSCVPYSGETDKQSGKIIWRGVCKNLANAWNLFGESCKNPVTQETICCPPGSRCGSAGECYIVNFNNNQD